LIFCLHHRRGSSLGEASIRQTCRCPERSRDPNGLPGPVESRRDLMRLRPPGLYGVWCRTLDVEEYRGSARVACSAVEIASDPTAFLCCGERGGEVQRWTAALVATTNPRPVSGDYHARAPSETACSQKGNSAMLNLTSSRPSATANAARARTIENLRRFADRAARTLRADALKRTR
jgi:hypothetical protein